MKGSSFIVYEEGVKTGEKFYETNILRQQVRNLSYVKNLSVSEDVFYSPFELDRFDHNGAWAKQYQKIKVNFPKFVPVFLFTVYYTGIVPDLITFSKIYMEVYMEPVPKKQMIKDTSFLFSNGQPNGLSKTGRQIQYSDGSVLNNKIIRYKKRYEPFFKLPINQMTTEQVVERIRKVYGSIVRDFYHPVIFNYYGADTYYSYYEDLSGIDMRLNNIPCYAFTKTKAAESFGVIKRTQRHSNLKKDIGIYIKVNIKKDKGFYIIPDTIVKDSLIELENHTQGFFTIEY